MAIYDHQQVSRRPEHKHTQDICITIDFDSDRRYSGNLCLHSRNSRLMPKRQLRRRQRRRNLLNTPRLNIIPIPIHPQPQLPALGIHNPTHPIRAAQRLMLLESMPAINRNAIIPPGPELREPRVLWLELERRDLLEGVFLGIPLDADVVDGLLGEVLQQLCAEGVGYFVRHVEAPVLL